PDQAIEAEQGGDRPRFDDGPVRIPAGEAGDCRHRSPPGQDDKLDLLASFTLQKRGAKEALDRFELRKQLPTKVFWIGFTICAPRPAAPFPDDHPSSSHGAETITSVG